jgi:ribosomal protein L32
MRCPSCACENPADARFCERCGNPIATQEVPAQSRAEMPGAAEVCPTCGASKRPGLRFCEECATPFPETTSTDVAEPVPAKENRIPVSASPPPAEPSPAVVRPVQPVASVPRPVTEGGRVCTACGYLNPTSARHCADCGEALVVRREPLPARPSTASRVLGILMRIAVSVVIAVVTAVATRYLMSYVIGLGLIP